MKELNRDYKFKTLSLQFNLWDRLFRAPKCPDCKKKMKRQESAWEAYWRCPCCEWEAFEWTGR